MSNLSQKLKTVGAIATIGGSLFAGSQVGRPTCDFVFVSEDKQKEVCLTTEQAEFILDNVKGKNTGFGQSQFNDLSVEKK